MNPGTPPAAADPSSPAVAAEAPPLASSPGGNLGRLHAWGMLLGKYVGIQVVVQFFTLASGILVVRSLSKRDYGLFTIANTMMAMMNVLADSGIGSGLTSIGGRIWHDPHRFGQLIRTALDLRRRFAGIAILVVTPFLDWLLLRNGAQPWQVAWITLLVLASLYGQLSNGVLTVIPRLLLQTSRLQRIDISCAVVRLALLGVAAATLLNVSTALAIATVTLFFQGWLLRRWIRGSIDPKAPPDPAMRQEIFSIVKRQAPNGIYYCLQGQVSIWLISVFGSANKVADVGALGRLAVIFGVIGSVMTSIIIPRFVRCQERAMLLRRYLQIIGIYALLVAAFVAVALLFPDQLLFVLGNKYARLHHELVMIVLSTSITSFVGVLWSLNVARGWFLPPWFNISASILSQMIAISLVDLSTVQGVILVGLAPCVPESILFASCALYSIRHHTPKTDSPEPGPA